MTSATYPIGHPAAAALPRNAAQRRPLPAWAWGVFILAHVPFAYAVETYPLVGLAHALVVVALGMVFAATVRSPERLLGVVFYITGCQVLWRMCEVQIFWEFGKYAIILLLTISMLRFHREKPPLLPVLYFALLIPSTIITFTNNPADLARQLVSFNLSGPLAVTVCVMYFSRHKLSFSQLRQGFLIFMGPAIGIVYLCVQGVLSRSEITFSNDSNDALSGGFGPNQVSAILGLAALFCFLVVVSPRMKPSGRLAAIAGMLLFATQSAVTFSRGGLYCAGAAMLVGLWYALKGKQSRKWVLFGVGVALVAAQFVIIPRLQSFTGGMIGTRFSDTSPTHRIEMVEAEVSHWQENPLLGVGPGMMTSKRLESTRSAGHTEISRIMAEHGTLGIISIGMLIPGLVAAVRRPRSPQAKGLMLALLVWAVMYTMTAAMRLVAPALILGLIHIKGLIDFEEATAPAPASPHPREHGAREMARVHTHQHA